MGHVSSWVAMHCAQPITGSLPKGISHNEIPIQGSSLLGAKKPSKGMAWFRANQGVTHTCCPCKPITSGFSPKRVNASPIAAPAKVQNLAQHTLRLTQARVSKIDFSDSHRVINNMAQLLKTKTCGTNALNALSAFHTMAAAPTGQNELDNTLDSIRACRPDRNLSVKPSAKSLYITKGNILNSGWDKTQLGPVATSHKDAFAGGVRSKSSTPRPQHNAVQQV